MAIAILQGIGGKVPQEKSIKIERDGNYTVAADEGYELEAVEIVVDTPDKKPEEELDLGVIKTNGAREVYPSAGSVFSKVTFEVDVDRGTEQFDNRLDGIIALQNGYIGGGYKPSEGLEYCFDENSYSVRGIGSCADEVVVIPPEYEGYPVTSIEMLESKTMKELILPDSVSWIASTVNGCTALERVVFGSGFAAINYWSFGGNINCKAYDFSRCQKIPTIDLYDNPDYYVFLDMPDDCEIIVPPELLDEWKSATNWTVFADHIVAAESVADNGTSDEVYNTTEERLEAIEGNVPEVHSAGIEEGRTAERSEFWNGYQRNGNLGSWLYSFYTDVWTDDMYNPIHPINLSSQSGSTWAYSAITDTKVPISVSWNGYIPSLFSSAIRLKTIPSLTIADTVTGFTSWFYDCRSLITVIFHGTIAADGLDLHWSTKLSKESFISIIDCLSPTTSGLTVTLSKAAKEAAFTADEWSALIATKSNWTISLV